MRSESREGGRERREETESREPRGERCRRAAIRGVRPGARRATTAACCCCVGALRVAALLLCGVAVAVAVLLGGGGAKAKTGPGPAGAGVQAQISYMTSTCTKQWRYRNGHKGLRADICYITCNGLCTMRAIITGIVTGHNTSNTATGCMFQPVVVVGRDLGRGPHNRWVLGRRAFPRVPALGVPKHCRGRARLARRGAPGGPRYVLPCVFWGGLCVLSISILCLP
jgi:hypothetical protein